VKQCACALLRASMRSGNQWVGARWTYLISQDSPVPHLPRLTCISHARLTSISHAPHGVSHANAHTHTHTHTRTHKGCGRPPASADGLVSQEVFAQQPVRERLIRILLSSGARIYACVQHKAVQCTFYLGVNPPKP
jgi:hypothetical protein